VKKTQLLIDACCKQYNLKISGFACSKLTKFLHDVEGSSLVLMPPSMLRYCDTAIGYKMRVQRMKVVYAIMNDLSEKLIDYHSNIP